MLGKLLKYEIKAMGRVMLPLYVAMLFIAGLFALNLRLGMNPSMKSIMEKIAIIAGFLFVICVMAVAVVMAVMVIQRYYKNLLGNEGYLMFSLPVTTMDHILSKGLSSFLWILIGFATGIASGFLMVGIVSDLPEFMEELTRVRQLFFQGHTKDLILLIIVALVGVLEALCKVYAAISVGHLFNGHRLFFSIVAYIAFGSVEMIIMLPLSKDGLVFGRVIDAVMDAEKIPTSGFLWIMIVISLIGMVIYGAVAWYLLDRKLNLE